MFIVFVLILFSHQFWQERDGLLVKSVRVCVKQRATQAKALGLTKAHGIWHLALLFSLPLSLVASHHRLLGLSWGTACWGSQRRHCMIGQVDDAGCRPVSP